MTIGQCLLQDYGAKLGLAEPGVEKHIYLPANFIKDLQESCQKEVDGILASTGEEAIISKMDVVNAWWLKRIYANLRENIVVTMGYAFNFSDRIPQVSSEKFFQGHYYGVYLPLGTVAEVKKESIARLALKIRRSVARAKQPSVIRDNLEFFESVQNQKIIPQPKGGEIEGCPLFSSWNRFPFEKLDFSPALAGNQGTGRVLFNNSRIVLPMNITWKPKLLFFNDAEGGVWCQSMQLPSHWKGFGDIKEYERM
ncbi:hypothetical protein ABW20_dc0109976 [Dactylellina cionopaga]|nr:hypothetical protein ABW20_dc0109976 [Dactylellina cionopaga]